LIEKLNNSLPVHWRPQRTCKLTQSLYKRRRRRYGRIHHNNACWVVRIARSRFQGNQAAHTVPNDNRLLDADLLA
jgi:hypothetical protein